MKKSRMRMEWNEVKKNENVVECECEKTECEWNECKKKTRNAHYILPKVKTKTGLKLRNVMECSGCTQNVKNVEKNVLFQGRM